MRSAGRLTLVAVERVAEAVAYAIPVAPNVPREYLTALATGEEVRYRLSALRYRHLRESGRKLPTGGDDAVISELALKARAGLCGQSSSLAMMIYRQLGVTARQLDLLHAGGGHTTPEVWYEDGWHWVDPAFGYFYRQPLGKAWDVQSVVEAAMSPGVRVDCDALLWPQIASMLGERLESGLDILSAPDLRVTLHQGAELYRR